MSQQSFSSSQGLSKVLRGSLSEAFWDDLGLNTLTVDSVASAAPMLPRSSSLKPLRNAAPIPPHGSLTLREEAPGLGRRPHGFRQLREPCPPGFREAAPTRPDGSLGWREVPPVRRDGSLELPNGARPPGRPPRYSRLARAGAPRLGPAPPIRPERSTRSRVAGPTRGRRPPHIRSLREAVPACGEGARASRVDPFARGSRVPVRGHRPHGLPCTETWILGSTV